MAQISQTELLRQFIEENLQKETLVMGMSEITNTFIIGLLN